MHHFVTEMFTFLLQNGALWDIGLVHCGVCATDLLEKPEIKRVLSGIWLAKFVYECKVVFD